MRIISRHEALLMNRLDQVTDIGCAHITKNELKAWYDAERIGISVWRDINEKWIELVQSIDKRLAPEDKNSPLFCGQTENGYTFIWGRGLQSNKKAFFQDLKDWT